MQHREKVKIREGKGVRERKGKTLYYEYLIQRTGMVSFLLEMFSFSLLSTVLLLVTKANYLPIENSFSALK